MMNWLQKIANWQKKMASPEAWLRSQGIPDEILQYALSNTFPRKIQKWVALQLHQVHQNQVHQEGYKKENHLAAGEIIERNKQNLIEIRDWFNHESAKPAVDVVNPETGKVVIDPNTDKPKRTAFGINNFTIESALKEVDIWQVEMVEVRGEGHVSFYTQPDYNAEDLGNGFRMVEVVADDLKNEGKIMQHCVGDDTQNYRGNVKRGNVRIFSLRDYRGWPHATIEVKSEDSENEIMDSYEARQSQIWNVEQIYGKQSEIPINKYRPFLKSWLQSHPEFNPSENDLLSVTPSPELLQAIMNNKGNLSEKELETGTYRKYFDHLDEEDMVRLMQQVINDQGVGWSDQAISDAITLPVVNGWFDAADADDSAGAALGEFFRGDDSTVMAREQHNAFIQSLTSHDSPDIRSSAYSRISVDPRYRTPEGLQEFTQIALNESSAKVVAVILPNFFTYPNKDSKDSMERYRNPLFTPEMFSFAMHLSEKFKGEPESDELHAKIAVGLAPQADPQVIARAVTNRFIGQRIGDGSTYEVRNALEKMDESRFGQVWALLDPTLRRFLLFEEIKGYNSMVNKHREVINLYPKEMAFKRENGGLNPPGLGTIFQPQGTEDESIRTQNTPSSPGVPPRDDLGQALLNQFGPVQSGPPIGFPGREAESNWFKRIAQQDLPFTSIDVSGRRFETGVPVEFKYVRNNQKAPDFGSQYQQDIEPAGRYLTHNEDPGSEDYLAEMKSRGWEYGLAKFENPLVITFNTKNQVSYDEHSWKAALSRKFGGIKGEALAHAIASQGYDGIVTVHANDKGEPQYVSEIVDLSRFTKQE